MGTEIEEKVANLMAEDNKAFNKIANLIYQGRNIFITGHAGTGKSFLLNKLRRIYHKMIITSTTGLAAVNVKGQTIHSWCGVGICNKPIDVTVKQILNNSTKLSQIRNAKQLAIDEISMLNLATFEYIDIVLRCVREIDEPFGGIQVVFIGDFFQLPPVEKSFNTERKYCFESPVWKDLELETIILHKTYRQSDEKFIKALSNMRINSLTKEDIKLIKTREFDIETDSPDVLHIFATNFEADKYNKYNYDRIEEQEHIFNAVDSICYGREIRNKASNKYEEMLLSRLDNFNVEKTISLKVGARVMLLINLNVEKGLINGSCGVIKSFKNDYINIKFDSGVEAKIYKHEFELYEKDEKVAQRKQYPLKLAYGITIHKSQGMSLDKLVVDCSKIFEKGQAYVAISRIKTLEGLMLYNFSPRKVMVDERVAEFYKSLKSNI